MAKEKKQTLVGGNKAHLVNPLRLVKQYKAVCVEEGIVLSADWRDTKSQAREDAKEHIDQGHYIDYNIRIKS